MKKITAIFFTAMIALTTITFVIADAKRVEGVDIMIIIDKSDSINWNDPNLEILEATNQILNLSLGTGNRVGYVVYNDTIIAYQGLRVIETTDDVDEMMDSLRSIRASRGTDVGLAFQMARRQLDLDYYRTGRTAIVFLSDGWFEFSLFNLNRDLDDVAADIEDVVTTISYPIFTIQYSVQNLYDSPKSEWAQHSGGESFTAMNPDEMVDAVNEVYELIEDMLEYEYTDQQESEIDRVYEHQLVISIPSSETEYAEVVEVTLMGEGLIQEVITPDDNDYITVNADGENYIITITDPQQESYTIYYLTSSDEPFETNIVTQMVEIYTPIDDALDESMFLTVGIGVGGAFLLILLVLLIVIEMKKQKVRKAYPALSGTLECYFMEIPTGMKDIPIQSWSASFLAAKNKVSLDKLLKKIPLLAKMPEAEKIFASINADNTISITNKAGIVCYKNGREVVDNQISLCHGEGLYMVFQKNTIEIELRAKQGSLR